MMVQTLTKRKVALSQNKAKDAYPTLRRLCLIARRHQRKTINRFFALMIEKLTFPVSEAGNMRIYLQILQEENVGVFSANMSDVLGGDLRRAEPDTGANELRQHHKQFSRR